MAQTDIIGPDSDIADGGWAPVGSFSLWITLDDLSDSTYVEWTGGATQMIVGLDTHAPPTGMRRHSARVLLRGAGGTVNTAVRLSDASLVAPATMPFPGSVSSIPGSWGLGLPTTGVANLSAVIVHQTPSPEVMQLRVEIDNREAPVFTADIWDGTGASSTTITDTSTPTAVFSGLELDGLSGRNYRVWVTDDNDSAAIVFDTGIVSGRASDTPVGPLANGDYTLRMQAWSTVGLDEAFASDIETLGFEIATTTVDGPEDVTATVDAPWVNIDFTVPEDTLETLDDGSLRVQVERTDCNGSSIVLSGEGETVSLLRPTALTWGDSSAGWSGDSPAYGGGEVEFTTYGFIERDWDLINGGLVSLKMDPGTFFDLGMGSAGYTIDLYSRPFGPDVAVTWNDASDSGATSFTPPAGEFYVRLGYLNGRFIFEWSEDGVEWVQVLNVEPELTGFTDFDFYLGGEYATFSEFTVWSQGLYTRMTDWTAPRTVVGSCDEDSNICEFSYRVRFIGTVDGLPAVSAWVPVDGEYTMEWTPGEHLIRTNTPDGPVYASLCGTINWGVTRPFTVSDSVNGGQQVYQGSVAGHDISVSLSVRNQAELEEVETVLGSALVLMSPADSLEGWAAPVSFDASYVKVGRVRAVGASMIGTGPEPVI